MLSKINTIINVNYLTSIKENLYFERKRAKVSMQDLANEIASFSNANGGVIAVGITDDGKIEGFNSYGINKLNDFQKIVTNYLSPTPNYKTELIEVENNKNEKDNILLFHIEPALNFIVRNNKDEVYLRQGDSSIKLNAEQVRSLEYEKRERNFESEVLNISSIDNLDLEVMDIYKDKIGATEIPNEQVLKARGFLVEDNGKLRFTKAGILLFGKNPSVYIPNARVRVLKFEGTNFQVGTEMNIVKDRTFDKCLYKILE